MFCGVDVDDGSERMATQIHPVGGTLRAAAGDCNARDGRMVTVGGGRPARIPPTSRWAWVHRVVGESLTVVSPA
jgi:hypothetical protein